MQRITYANYDETTDHMYTYDLSVDLSRADKMDVRRNHEERTKNNSHRSYEIEGKLECDFNGLLYVVSNPSERDKQLLKKRSVLVIESYEEYLEKITKLTESNYRWIYDIVDRKSENESVIDDVSDYILMADYTWDQKYLEQLHLLIIVKDKQLKSVRDIEQNHIDKLKKYVDDSIKKVSELYGFGKNQLKVFFHYPPSVFLLHIHVAHVNRIDAKTSFEKCLDFYSVMKNIQLDKNYYHDDMRILTFDKTDN